MRTDLYRTLVATMSPNQQIALEKLCDEHPDLQWEGGKADTEPKRVSLKKAKKSIAAINTRKGKNDIFLRLEFRKKDYDGPEGVFVKHKNFNKAYDLRNGSSDVTTASKIIGEIKRNY